MELALRKKLERERLYFLVSGSSCGLATWCCKTHCHGCRKVALDLCWGIAKHCVFKSSGCSEPWKVVCVQRARLLLCFFLPRCDCGLKWLWVCMRARSTLRAWIFLVADLIGTPAWLLSSCLAASCCVHGCMRVCHVMLQSPLQWLQKGSIGIVWNRRSKTLSFQAKRLQPAIKARLCNRCGYARFECFLGCAVTVVFSCFGCVSVLAVLCVYGASWLLIALVCLHDCCLCVLPRASIHAGWPFDAAKHIVTDASKRLAAVAVCVMRSPFESENRDALVWPHQGCASDLLVDCLKFGTCLFSWRKSWLCVKACCMWNAFCL